MMNDQFEMFNGFINKYIKITADELLDLNLKCRVIHFSKGGYCHKSRGNQSPFLFYKQRHCKILYR